MWDAHPKDRGRVRIIAGYDRATSVGDAMTGPTVDADVLTAIEAAGWQRQAAGYEDFFRPAIRRLIEPLLDAADVGRAARALDVACGPGCVAAKAAGRAASVVGVDVAHAMISLARRLHPQLEFRPGNAEALPVCYGSSMGRLGTSSCCMGAAASRRPRNSPASSPPVARLALAVWDRS
jgi:SAM-dependent methyltransferase